MPAEVEEIVALPPALEAARAGASEAGWPYAGGVTPTQPDGWRFHGLPWVQD
jgi:hypothetical protein